MDARRNRCVVGRGKVVRLCLPLCAVLLALLAARQLHAQLRDEIPHASYYAAVEELYRGEYRSAERALRRETQRGVRTAQLRWIDSICYHAMLGEVFYNQGRNAEALAEFEQACRMVLAYPEWMLRVEFHQPPRPDPNLARRAVPWGQSDRRFTFGQFADSEQVAIGQLDNRQAARQGGVVSLAQYWRVNVIEIVRCSALAIRRRNEILGPLAKHDPVSRELAEVLSRGGIAQPNHWSSAWIDLLRGVALAGVDKSDQAAALLDRAVVVDEQFDHPLTCVALLEQGRIALSRGDGAVAAKLFAEAGFSAYYYENWDVLTESLMLGWANHMASGGQGVYPPLANAAAWAQANRLQHIATKARLADAESLLWSGNLAGGAAALDEAGRRIGDMRGGLPGIHLLYVQAVAQLLQGRIGPSSEVLEQALGAQATASLRNFQIVRTGELFDARQVSPRVAVQLYETLLRDPLPADWALRPLESMAVLKTAHGPAFDRWFVAALERKEVPLALEIAEQTKRRRFLASLPLGGRLLALRAILEAPINELTQDAVLQRQQLLTGFPGYRELTAASDQLQQELREGPVLAGDGDDAKQIGDRYETWGKNARARERLLLEFALRRVPSSLEFPPWRKAAELQQALGEGEAAVVFHAAAGGLYGFLLTRDDSHMWQLNDERLRGDLGTLLRDLGNYGPNKTLSIAELQSDEWREASAGLFVSLFADARLDLDKTKTLTIVPDGLLWYLPFELLVPPRAGPKSLLADAVPIRYGPTAALALGQGQPLRRTQHTGIVANEFAANEAVGGDEAIQQLEEAVIGPVRLSSPLPEPASLVAPLLDELIVLDELESGRGSNDWSLLPRGRGKSDGLEAWFGLPYGGPQRIVATGFATAAEQGLKPSRRNQARGIEPGGEIFQALCTMMASGARTILLTRWRTGGRTNFELVREFVLELPHSSATDAWQRAAVLAREAPLDTTREPRLKRVEDSGEPLTADHPLFWAGYLLVDAGAQPVAEEMLDDEVMDPPAIRDEAGVPEPEKPEKAANGRENEPEADAE